jgi:hypothetical protein
MSPEKQRIAIAEACGWIWEKTCQGSLIGKPKGEQGPLDDLPDYLNDLNAMREAEKALLKSGWVTYLDWLVYVIYGSKKEPSIYYGSICHATAAQRAEAFLRTLNKWED